MKTISYLIAKMFYHLAMFEKYRSASFNIDAALTDLPFREDTKARRRELAEQKEYQDQLWEKEWGKAINLHNHLICIKRTLSRSQKRKLDESSWSFMFSPFD